MKKAAREDTLGISDILRNKKISKERSPVESVWARQQGDGTAVDIEEIEKWIR